MTINKVKQKIRWSISWYKHVQPRLDNVEHLSVLQISGIQCHDLQPHLNIEQFF
jgi:hypothetical protein